ncbi:MAG: 50S ribosomal protein L3 [Planctomycetota bacterium]|nr:50S ribosomal protein L3 [Planctomycetota bacterium]
MSSATGILGRKVGMTQVFDETGNRVGVTVLECGPCKVLQVKDGEKDGYHAIQLGFGAKKEKNTAKPLLGHFAKAASEPKRLIREIRLGKAPEDKLGDEVTVAIFEGIQKVDVTGASKGKGFAGTIKRYNFQRQRATHGNSKHHRALGSLGRHMSINKGVPKGKKMPGHMGDERVTVQGLKVVKVDAEHNLLLVQGAVPGCNGAFVTVRKSIQEKVREDKAKRPKF